MNNNDNHKNTKPIVIGIGGISRAGKSTITRSIISLLKIKEEDKFAIDKYLISPINKYDTEVNETIEDWEDPACYDLDRLYKDFKSHIENCSNESNSEPKIIIVYLVLWLVGSKFKI